MLSTHKATAPVQELFDRLIAEGQEVGLQAAAYLDGELVLDTWAGTADEQTGRVVDGDTLFVVFSATKGVTGTSIHMLAERGKIDYERPVADYWPAYGKHGKAATTVRQAMSHQAGIPQMPQGWGPERMCDWDATVAAIADLTPIWEPGSRTQYHGMTFGWIMGELLRRVDGRTVRQFVYDEIAQPIGAPDLHVGTTPALLPRVARLRNAPGGATNADQWNRDDLRQAIVPAAGGQFSARSLARMYAALANGGELNGVRLVSPVRIDVFRTQQSKPADAAEIGM
jgi:CubicO group peptidase (beta-lactamase class C family)